MIYRNIGSPVRRAESFGVLRAGAWVEDTEARRGECFEPTPDELLKLAYKLQLVEEVEPASPVEQPEKQAPDPEPVDPLEPYAKGGGHYEFPDGSTVRGKDAATQKLAELEAAEANSGADG